MNTSSWPMFLIRTLSGCEMAPATFFKKVSKMLTKTSHQLGCGFIVLMGMFKYFVFFDMEK